MTQLPTPIAIRPGQTIGRLRFQLFDANDDAVENAVAADFTSFQLYQKTDQVSSAVGAALSVLSDAADDTAAKSSGTIIQYGDYNVYSVDITISGVTGDTCYVVGTMVDGTRYTIGTDYTIAEIPTKTEINAEVDAALGDADVSTQASVDAIDNMLDTVLSDTNELVANQGNWLTATGFAEAGDAMALTPTERSTLAGVIEVEFMNDLTGEAFLAGIQSSIQALFDQDTDVPVATLVALIRDGILDRVVSGNHDTAGSVGKLLQFLDALISSRNAVSPPAASENAEAVRAELTEELAAITNATSRKRRRAW